MGNKRNIRGALRTGALPTKSLLALVARLLLARTSIVVFF